MNDIPELYERFDGNAGDYQELRRSDLADAARERWPLVAAVASAPVVMPPGVFRGDRSVQPHTGSEAHAPACAEPDPSAAPPPATNPPAPRSGAISSPASFRARLAAAWRGFLAEGRS